MKKLSSNQAKCSHFWDHCLAPFSPTFLAMEQNFALSDRFDRFEPTKTDSVPPEGLHQCCEGFVSVAQKTQAEGFSLTNKQRLT